MIIYRENKPPEIQSLLFWNEDDNISYNSLEEFISHLEEVKNFIEKSNKLCSSFQRSSILGVYNNIKRIINNKKNFHAKDIIKK